MSIPRSEDFGSNRIASVHKCLPTRPDEKPTEEEIDPYLRKLGKLIRVWKSPFVSSYTMQNTDLTIMDPAPGSVRRTVYIGIYRLNDGSRTIGIGKP